MTTTDAELELTEFEEMSVELVNGVKSPANGAGHLLMKGLGDAAKAMPADDGGEPDVSWRHDPMVGTHEHAHPSFGAADGDGDGMHAHSHRHGSDGTPDAVHDHGHPVAKAVVNGKIDQRPDIKIADQILALVGKAMGNESGEVEAGSHGEVHDVALLTEVHRLVQQWRAGEMHPEPEAAKAATGCGCCETCTMPADAAKATLTAAGRSNLSDSDFAYIDSKGGRHLPVHDKAHAQNALARFSQTQFESDDAKAKARAKVMAAAKKFGISTDDDSASKSTAVADEGADVDTLTQGSDTDTALVKAVADAVTKATQPVLDRLAAKETELDGLLAKVKATPIPGGPVLSAAATTRRTAEADGEDHAAKSAYFAQMAERVTDKQSADGYRILARQHADKARNAAAPAAP